MATLVEMLPTSFPAPIVIAQHLDPTHLSHLGAILARRSVLPMVTCRSTRRFALAPFIWYWGPLFNWIWCA